MGCGHPFLPADNGQFASLVVKSAFATGEQGPDEMPPGVGGAVGARPEKLAQQVLLVGGRRTGQDRPAGGLNDRLFVGKLFEMGE